MLPVLSCPVLGILLVSLPGILGSCYYAKFTPDHSACLPPNPTCNIVQRGITDKDKQQILDLHNQYRSQIANGRETQAGGMPGSSNMMEMEWDDELAAISQNYAEQCKFEHDCNNCREVDRFPVGQNLCLTGSSVKPADFDWATVMKTYYDEVTYFNKNYIKPYVFQEPYAHFTQLVWATSRLVGCGVVMYTDEGFYDSLYVCNYGPAGNLLQGEMYMLGSPCSSCPANASSCTTGQNSGLCGASNSIVSTYTTKKTPTTTKTPPQPNQGKQTQVEYEAPGQTQYGGQVEYYEAPEETQYESPGQVVYYEAPGETNTGAAGQGNYGKVYYYYEQPTQVIYGQPGQTYTGGQYEVQYF